MVNAGFPAPPSRVGAREIAPSDFGAVIDLLHRGFHFRRSRGFWQKVFAGLEQHSAPAGLPRYGYLLDIDGKAVGVILLIFSKPGTGRARDALRCNVSSWYVEPAYRSYAPLLAARALQHREATYLNLSAAPNTRPIVQAQGYATYSNGLFVAFLALQRRAMDAKATLIPAHRAPPGFEPFKRDLLHAHAAYGCLSFWCVTPERAYPFVFRRRYIKAVMPCAQLVYCDDIADIARFPGLIGRYLLRHFCPIAVIDANGTLPGLIGVYLDGLMPKYFKGRERPRLGDLAYTEAALFGM